MRLRGLAFTPLAAVAALSAQAQESTDPATTLILPPVSVTATRSPIAAFDYPGQFRHLQRVTVLDTEPWPGTSL